MKRNAIKWNFIIILIFLSSINIYSWEIYDRVIATVNEMPIIESEIMEKIDRVQKAKNAAQKINPYDKSRMLDRYIEEAIVAQTAAEESIIVSDEKVNNHIEKIMTRMNVPSLDAFKKQIEQTEKISFDDYREELRKNLVAQDVISIAVGISPPTMQEARLYYEKNKSKVGFEVNIQHVLLRTKNDGFEENKRVNKEIKDLYGRVLKGERFEDIAKQYSDDKDSRDKGGNLGWLPLSNVARDDMIYANNIYKEFVIGKSKMAVIKSNSGYHLVRFGGSRVTSFEGAKDDILGALYQMKQAEQFQRWVNRRRLESEIKIYMEDYVKEKGYI
jgi:putative peptidyl-prolyl cis-trans isomerase